MVFASKILKQVNLNKDEKQVTTQIYKDKGAMTVHDVRRLVDGIKAKGNKEYGFFDVALVRVLNGDKWSSFSNEEQFESYYAGKVADPTKFDDVFQMQITTIFSD